jgi:RND family efflux transporter MFP subunit
MSGNGMLFKLVVDRPLKLKAMVPERYRAEVRLGQQSQLEVEAYPGQIFTGQVARISPTVDRVSRTFQVEIHVPNEDRKLQPGSFAKAAILSRISDAPTVPDEAIVRFAGVTKIFVVHEGKAHEVQVRTGLSVTVDDTGRPRTWSEVIGDVPIASRVVTSGHSQLADGSAIRVKERGTEP